MAIVILALIVITWLLHKLYFQKLWNQGKAGKIKIGLIALGIIFVALAATGRAPALFAIIGAAMTQVMRFAPLLVRFAPSLKSALGSGNAGMGSGAAGAGVSHVSTATIDMTLEQATGAVNGKIKKGTLAGRSLSELSIEQLRIVYLECKQSDPEAWRLLRLYLSRERAADWQDPDPGQRDEKQDNGTQLNSGDMNLSEARAVLGVDETAGEEEITAAHRTLMSRLHPDKGGSNYLAAKVNKAKALLLKSV